jgi:hypothetical protein
MPTSLTLRTSLPFLAALFLAACSPFGLSSKTYVPSPDPNHTHADFAIWIEGMKLDLSDERYMSGSSKDAHDEHKHRHPALHLHDGVGHVLHQHKPGLTLGEFLRSLGFEMTEQCLRLDTGIHVCPEGGKTWHMFVRNPAAADPLWKEVPLNPDSLLSDMDQILLTYQASDDLATLQIQKQQQALTEDACLYSKTCPWRGEPPEESCIADPEVPCLAPEE